MARDNPSYEGSQDRHMRQPGKPQGREAGARRAEREREIWAEENEKKDWKPGAPDKSQQKGNRPPGRNHEQPARKLGQQAQGRSDH